MIKLHQFPPYWGLPNASPFCLKLETYLRMAALTYKSHYLVDIRKTPKGKLPYIEDEGVKIADSSLIISYLQKKYGDKLDAHLSSEQKALALCVQRLVEEHLYWCNVYSRWIDPINWPLVKKSFFGKMPKLLQLFIPAIIQKKVRKTLYAQGIGRHSRDELMQLGLEDLRALAVILGDKPFMLGDSPSSIDAVVYGFLANILIPPVQSPLKDYAQTVPQFVDYCARIKEKYYA